MPAGKPLRIVIVDDSSFVRQLLRRGLEAVGGFERALLERLLPEYPSTRKLAERLGTSHSAIAARLRRYGLKA